MSVLVTGAAGFIGSHVTDMLLSQGRTVVGFDSFDNFYSPDRKERNLARARDHGGFTLVRGDIRDTDALRRLPEGIDTILAMSAGPLIGFEETPTGSTMRFDVPANAKSSELRRIEIRLTRSALHRGAETPSERDR